MHDRLLSHQDALQMPDLRDDAEEMGLDLEQFDRDVHRRRFAPRVAEDVASADASGVSGTPTFFINGVRHQGVYDVNTLLRAVKRAASGVRARVGAS